MAGEESPQTYDAPSDVANVRSRAIANAEFAVDAAFQSGRADRATITKSARDDALEAVRMVDEAMEADEVADEAGRLAVIAEHMGNRDKTKTARKRARNARKEAKQAHKAATRAARDAYDAIRYSQPGKLGFMRFVFITYGVGIATTLFALVLTSRDTIVYDSVTIVDWITIILEGVGFWFFINRFKITKPYVIATSAFGIVALIITSLINGTFSWFGTLMGSVWNIFLILYFLFSKRVDVVLVNDFASYQPRQQDQLEGKRGGWPFVRNLIMYFIIFSILGHWMEAAMCQLIRLGLVQGEYDPTNTMLWRDWLYPYPMEGAAVVIIALVLYPLWQYLLKKFEKPIMAYVASFFANALTCSIIEFSMGLIVNADHQLWDYSEMFGNIMGQVCLQNALAFGVAASIIAWVVYPMIERWIARVPNDTMNIVFVVVAVIGGILWSLYIIDPPANHQEASDASATEVVANTSDPAQLAQEDREKYKDAVLLTQFQIDDLRNILAGSINLSPEERETIERELNQLEADLNQLKATVHYEE